MSIDPDPPVSADEATPNWPYSHPETNPDNYLNSDGTTPSTFGPD